MTEKKTFKKCLELLEYARICSNMLEYAFESKCKQIIQNYATTAQEAEKV